MALHCERCGQENALDGRFCRHCGAPLATLTDPQQPSVDALIGQHVLGRYEVTELIGEGGMGRVYAAAQRVGTTTRKVAVKTLRAELGADPQVVKRFYREAETIVRLTHPNTIQFFDFGELPDRTLVIVMEFIEGGSLADALREGPLGPARFDAILTQICGALYEAHQLGIVHRDLKPDNILLTDRGGRSDFVKVLDFGIAKISSREDEKPEATRLTQQGMMVGTPPYMSPEQFSGEAVDARSDIYSLGVIAYEMLTGHLPFDAKTPWEWASKHMTAEPAPLRVNVQTGISERRAWAIGRALSKAPSERQRDVQELLAELTGTGSPGAAAVRATSTASAPAMPAAPTPIHLPRPGADADDPMVVGAPQRARRWAALGACALALAAGAGWWMSSGARPPAPAPLAALAPPAPVAPSTVAAAVSPAAAAPLRPVAVAAPDLEPRASQSRSAPRRSGPRMATAQASRVEPLTGHDASPRPASTPVAVVAPSPLPRVEPTPAPLRPTADPAIPAGQATEPDPVPRDLADRVKRALDMAGERPDVAVGMYQAAAAKYGAEHPALTPLKRALSSKGPARIRELVAAGRCAQAQALFRAMRGAQLVASPGPLFGRTCAAPK